MILRQLTCWTCKQRTYRNYSLYLCLWDRSPRMCLTLPLPSHRSQDPAHEMHTGGLRWRLMVSRAERCPRDLLPVTICQRHSSAFGLTSTKSDRS